MSFHSQSFVNKDAVGASSFLHVLPIKVISRLGEIIFQLENRSYFVRGKIGRGVWTDEKAMIYWCNDACVHLTTS